MDFIKTLGGLEVIFAAMWNFPFCEEIIRSCVMCIDSLSNIDNLMYVLPSTINGIAMLVQAMLNHPTAVDIQIYGCRSLVNCANSTKGLTMICKAQGVRAITSAMNRHRSNAELQEAGCRAISDLARGADEDMKDEFSISGTVSCLVYAMVSHHSQGVQNEGLRALGHTNPESKKIISWLGKVCGMLPQIEWVSRDEVGDGVAEVLPDFSDTLTFSSPGAGALEELDFHEDMRPLSMMRKPGYLTLQTQADTEDLMHLTEFILKNEDEAVLTTLAQFAWHGEEFAKRLYKLHGLFTRIVYLLEFAKTETVKTEAASVIANICRQPAMSKIIADNKGLVIALCECAHKSRHIPLRRAALNALANMCCTEEASILTRSIIVDRKAVTKAFLDDDVSVRVNACYVAYWIMKCCRAHEKAILVEDLEWHLDLATGIQSFLVLTRNDAPGRKSICPSARRGIFISIMALNEFAEVDTLANVTLTSETVFDAFRGTLEGEKTPFIIIALMRTLEGLCAYGGKLLSNVWELTEKVLLVYIHARKKSPLYEATKKMLKGLMMKLNEWEQVGLMYSWKMPHEVTGRQTRCPINVLKYAAKRAMEMVEEGKVDIPLKVWDNARLIVPREGDTCKHATELRTDVLNFLKMQNRLTPPATTTSTVEKPPS